MKVKFPPFLAALLSVVALLAIAAPAQAFQSGRSERAVCFNSPGDYGIGRICDFDTIDQCRQTQSGINGSCEVNPWYQAPYDPYQPPAPARARVYRGY
jgi:hypothetical protein